MPIFWLASEDHDLAEVSKVSVLGADGGVQQLTVAPQAGESVPVGGVQLGASVAAAVSEATMSMADGDVAELLRTAYQSDSTFAGAFARVFARLFADFGLILLDPSDVELHEIAKPLLKSAAEQSADLNASLLARGKELESARIPRSSESHTEFDGVIRAAKWGADGGASREWKLHYRRRKSLARSNWLGALKRRRRISVAMRCFVR